MSQAIKNNPENKLTGHSDIKISLTYLKNNRNRKKLDVEDL